ncbi:peptidase inhibitor family I36 protein [Kribbella sp. CA-293567]|uniref:peptidase inhibitor family I36 protein n=1 Tax=Kribbella sp. CA-293567 TaxID=3002436 RepID=UPI0022DDAA58|nr:peptidase inhibitor family I36 protein [Kribbella sp. CA-293567]WBQ02517.1 peptidase inhibitor family I36 protein [Kribbella sp. CA-293567]
MQIRKQGKFTSARKLVGLVAASGVAAVGLLSPAPAQAKVQETCFAPLGCLWHDRNFNGDAKQLDRSVPDLHPEGHGDKAHSLWNKSPYWMVLFADKNYRGSCISIKPAGYRGTPSRVWDLSAYETGGDDWGDRVSSVQFFQIKPEVCPEVGSG